MKDQERQLPKYATLLYDVKRELSIGWLDYIVLDMIYHLSARQGYCFKSVRAMARDLDMSFDAVRVAIKRLTDKELLLKLDEGYRCSDAYYQALSEYSDRKSVSMQKSDRKSVINRPKIGQTDRKQASSDRKQASQQMLDIHKNNNRKAPGTPRLNSRVPQPTKPLSEAAKQLQARIEEIRANEQNKSTSGQI